MNEMMYYLDEGHYAQSQFKAAEDCLVPLARPYLHSSVSLEWLHSLMDYLSECQSSLIERQPRIKPAALSITKGWKQPGEPDSYMLHIGAYSMHARPIKSELHKFVKPND